MKSILILLLVLFVAAYSGIVMSEFLDDSESVKNFIKLIDEHNLNVSVLISQAKKRNDSSVQEATTLAITLSLKKHQTQPLLNKESVENLFKSATEENLTAFLWKSIDGDLTAESINDPSATIPTEKATRLYLFAQTISVTNPFISNSNYGAQFTFIKPDGSLSKVLYGNLNVTVLEAQSVNEEEIQAAKRAVVEAFFEYEYDDLPQAIGRSLKKKWPNVQVLMDAGEGSFLGKTEKFLVLDNLNTKFQIFVQP